MRTALRSIIRALGFDVIRYRPQQALVLPPDCSDRDKTIIGKIAPFTMTSVDRQMTLMNAVRHLVRQRIEGCIVECGVWRGGSSMASALTMIDEGDTSRDLYLYDTFEGMTAPRDEDRGPDGTPARTLLDRDPVKATWNWAVASLEDVRRNMASTGYPAERIHYIQGPIESTIPAHSPAEPIALLRLDTDWYESTKHELIHLFPRLSKRGILIIDDYGHWQGARKAVDEYFSRNNETAYLHRIDYTGRLFVND